MESATRNPHPPGGSTAPATAPFALAALLLALASADPGAAGAVSTNPGTAGAPPPNTPGMLRVTVEAELSCPSCARGLERRLGRLAHVAGVEVRPADGRIVLTVEPGSHLELAAVHDAVRNAGFVPDRVVVTVVGRLTHADGALALALSPDFALPLAPNGRAAALTAEAGSRLAQVSGHWDAGPDGPGRLHVESFEVR